MQVKIIYVCLYVYTQIHNLEPHIFLHISIFICYRYVLRLTSYMHRHRHIQIHIHTHMYLCTCEVKISRNKIIYSEMLNTHLKENSWNTAVWQGTMWKLSFKANFKEWKLIRAPSLCTWYFSCPLGSIPHWSVKLTLTHASPTRALPSTHRVHSAALLSTAPSQPGSLTMDNPLLTSFLMSIYIMNTDGVISSFFSYYSFGTVLNTIGTEYTDLFHRYLKPTNW